MKWKYFLNAQKLCPSPNFQIFTTKSKSGASKFLNPVKNRFSINLASKNRHKSLRIIMPSGAKKRKAAKKKKKSVFVQSHGGEDLEHHNEKESDGGDVSSPASQDNRNGHEFSDHEEEGADKQENGSRDQSSVHELKSDEITNGGEEMEKGTVEEESAIHVERELEVEDEPSKEHHEESLPRSSSSSSCSNDSEDGSTAADKDKVVADITHAVEIMKEADPLSAYKVNDVETTFVYVLNKSAMSGNGEQVEKCISDGSDLMGNGEKIIGTVDETVEELHDNDAVNATTQVNGEKVTLSRDDPEDHASIVAEGVGEKEDEAVHVSHDKDAEASDELDTATQGNGEKVTLSHDVPKVHESFVDNGVEKNEGEAVHNSHDKDAEVSDELDTATQGNGDKVTLSHNAPKVHESSIDNGVEKKEDEAVHTSQGNDVKTSEPKDYGTEEKGDMLTPSYNAPKIDADPVKDTEFSERANNQHQANSALQPVQTSWKGCCGLLELFTGSNR